VDRVEVDRIAEVREDGVARLRLPRYPELRAAREVLVRRERLALTGSKDKGGCRDGDGHEQSKQPKGGGRTSPLHALLFALLAGEIRCGGVDREVSLRRLFVRGPRWRRSVIMPSVALGPVELYYETAGSGEPVIFIPGFATNLHLWDHQFEPISRHFQCVRFDLRGQGKSSAPPEGYATADFAGDMQELMEHLNLARSHLVAASMGGAIAKPAGSRRRRAWIRR
jgi:hypothetical protein